MKTTDRRKSSGSTGGEPSWRKQPPKRRPKVRQNKAVITSLPKLSRLRPSRPWAIRLPRISWRYLALLPLLALSLFAVIELATNDRFYVYSAEIHGNQRITTDEIYSAADIDRKNILWVNPADVSRKILAVPGIANAQVRVWPPNRVTIEVQEKTPLAVWQVGDKLTWIAGDGQPVPAMGAAPALTLIDSDGAAAGQAAESTAGKAGIEASERPVRPAVIDALKVLHKRRPDLTQVSYGRTEGLYFVETQGGWTVYVGESGDISARLDLLDAAQATLAAEKVKPKVVDLRLDQRVVYR